jgi:hypothetical protein
MFVKAVQKSSGVNPVKLQKMKKKLGQRRELMVKVNFTRHFIKYINYIRNVWAVVVVIVW